LSLFLTQQYLEQIAEEIRVAIFGNVGTIMSFRVGAEDAAYLAKEFYPIFSQSDFINLPSYTMYLKLMIDGVTSKPFSAKSLNAKEAIQSNKKEIISQSQQQFEHSIIRIDRHEDETSYKSEQQRTLF
jgi:hypothetical protein